MTKNPRTLWPKTKKNPRSCSLKTNDVENQTFNLNYGVVLLVVTKANSQSGEKRTLNLNCAARQQWQVRVWAVRCSQVNSLLHSFFLFSFLICKHCYAFLLIVFIVYYHCCYFFGSNIRCSFDWSRWLSLCSVRCRKKGGKKRCLWGWL